MKLLSNKLGDDAVEEVILHVAVSFNYLWNREVDVMKNMYVHLPKKKREDIRHKLLTATSDQINELVILKGRREDQLTRWASTIEEWLPTCPKVSTSSPFILSINLTMINCVDSFN